MTQEKSNPYQAPLQAELVPSKPTRQSNLIQIGKDAFLHWEKLRLVYIAICGAVTLIAMMLFKLPLGKIEHWGFIIFGGIVANVCYFAGPVVETYLTWLGFNPKPFRAFAFILGVSFTSVCAVLAVYELTFV